MNKYIAIYVRRSVSDKEKGNNSLSIPAQIADCIKFVGGGCFLQGLRGRWKVGQGHKAPTCIQADVRGLPRGTCFKNCREKIRPFQQKYARISEHHR